MTLQALVIGLAVVATIYFSSHHPSKPPTAEVALQPSTQPTVPLAVPIPGLPTSATPAREESARADLRATTRDHPWVNSLGMKFVPIAGVQVLFSVWDTVISGFVAL